MVWTSLGYTMGQASETGEHKITGGHALASGTNLTWPGTAHAPSYSLITGWESPGLRIGYRRF
jgi:hypothetical protein